jgi:hypothetical protein
MKKLLVVSVLFLSFNAFSAIEPEDWKFEPSLGPSININGSANSFNINLKIGKDDMSGLLDFRVRGGFVGIRPAFVYDIPFYFTFVEDEDFSVGPTFDVGPGFGFGGGLTLIDFFDLGFGARATYQITDSFGVVFEPMHFSMGFVRWSSGIAGIGRGINTNFVMTYDLKFGVYLLF